MAGRVKVFAANWKMNKSVADCAEYFTTLKALLQPNPQFEVVIAPPATHLMTAVKEASGSSIQVSAQNCGTAKAGAFTGETSPVVLKELGVKWAIVGHSERRHVYKEDNALVLSRLKAGLEEGLKMIFCVGEKIDERRAGKTFEVVETQMAVLREMDKGFLKNVVVAYEPVWAIGTGENATPQQAQEVHAFIRAWSAKVFGSECASQMRVLYGGSVKAENSKDLMAQPDVDGLLVGGASLDATVFATLVKNGLLSLA